MNRYCADLHIHTVLSPCGDLEMSPARIVSEAAQKGLDIIAVTDHNHTGHAQLTRELGEEMGLWVVLGVEVTTAEEVHCLAFFDTSTQLVDFQGFIDDKLPRLANDTSVFGDQVIVDRNDIILDELTYSLYPGLKASIEEVASFVHQLGGLFVPAHIDRKMNGIYSQLGFFPENLEADALEIFRTTDRKLILAEKNELKGFQLLKNSDAHFVEHIGRAFSVLHMEDRSFSELRMALHGMNGRGVVQE